MRAVYIQMGQSCRRPEVKLRRRARRDAAAGRDPARGAVLLRAAGVRHDAGAQTAPREDDLPDAPSAQTSQSAAWELLASVAFGDGHAGNERRRRCGRARIPTTGGQYAVAGAAALHAGESDLTVCHVGVRAAADLEGERHAGDSRLSGSVQLHHDRGVFGDCDRGRPGLAVWPRFQGFGKQTGYGLVEDAQGEFFQTYAIASLVHQDPRYHRMPTASLKRRIWHAIEHTMCRIMMMAGGCRTTRRCDVSDQRGTYESVCAGHRRECSVDGAADRAGHCDGSCRGDRRGVPAGCGETHSHPHGVCAADSEPGDSGRAECAVRR